MDKWGGDQMLWHNMLAQKGYVVMSFDNRGTPVRVDANGEKVSIARLVFSLRPTKLPP